MKKSESLFVNLKSRGFEVFRVDNGEGDEFTVIMKKGGKLTAEIRFTSEGVKWEIMLDELGVVIDRGSSSEVMTKDDYKQIYANVFYSTMPPVGATMNEMLAAYKHAIRYDWVTATRIALLIADEILENHGTSYDENMKRIGL